jgi:naphthoate synthase/2-ketocyclohexanecarboxyl-CoA hydrolase
LAEGSTTTQGKYASNIRRAVDYLVSRSRANGLIGDPTRDDRYTYGHGFSMMFLSQVLGEEEDADRRQTLIDVLTRAVVFTGAGERAFCVGGDVRDPTRTAAQKRGLHHLHDRLAVAIRNNGKPIIVKVHGYCIGGGNELNVLCDLTISGESGRFGQAGPKIGSAPLWWGCQLMPAVVGEKKAREILYLTRQYTADEALAMGLVNKVVPDADLDAEVDAWCDEILRKSPQGLRLAKLAMNAMTDQLHGAVQHGLELVALNHVFGEEPREGIASFQEKRKPDWRKFRDGEGPDPNA